MPAPQVQAPLSKRVVAAGERALRRSAVPTKIAVSDFFTESDGVRTRFARVINAPDPARIAIIPAVSYGMAAVARNTAFEPGQNIVVVDEQFPSNIYTWRRTSGATGAELRTVPAPATSVDRGREWNAAVLEAIDDRTGLVTLPQLHWADGTRFDVERIGARARECGARFVVDGTQSVGAYPFDFRRVQPDALVCAAYKWLTGPYSIGFACFGPAYDEGVPLEETWIVRRGSEDFAGLVRYCDEYQPGAIRYDVGERSNFILLPLLTEALDQVLEWGSQDVQAYCRTLTREAVDELRAMGCWIEEDGARGAHLFGVRVPPTVEIRELVDALHAAQVSVSVRGAAIRVAPYVYNEPADMAALVAVVREVIARSRDL